VDIKNNEEKTLSSPKNPAGLHHWFLGGYAFLAMGAAIAYLILKYDWIYTGHWPGKLLVARLLLASTFAAVVLFISRLVEKLLRRKAHTRADRYNVIRFLRLLSLLIIFFIVISFLNANWYTAAVSLGLISLILGFALQTPIASLIGWFYIILRIPYRVGDRIQISNFTGDVVEVGYLDTTLWEFAGEYLTNDLPSGRLIRFPNSMVFQFQVYNYSWHKFPFIWNEIPFHVAYESDLQFVESRIREIAREELGEGMEEKVKLLRGILSETPVDELEIKEYPFVHYRINNNTWVEVLLIYLVEPKQSGAVRSRLIKKILADLSKEPEKVLFPKSNAR
jgi:small-conductance mechanosensitive channel